MGEAFLKHMKELLKKIKEPCKDHDGQPVVTSTGTYVCNKCGKEMEQ